MNPNYVLEVCADSVESVLAAVKGDADRIELCGNLVIGGTTPSESLYLAIRKCTDIPIHVLIRPRFGDFCYSDYEYAVMREEVKRFRELGADGVVMGILHPDGSLDTERLGGLMEEADGLSVTLHRAFDLCQDPLATVDQAVSLGMTTILTSGQKNSCLEGVDLLKKIRERAGEDIHILAGGGVHAGVIQRIHEETGITEFHMSGKSIVDSKMIYRKEGVSMGLPLMSEYDIYRTDENKVREAKKVLECTQETNRQWCKVQSEPCGTN